MMNSGHAASSCEAGDIRGEEDRADENEDDAEDDGPATFLLPGRHADATP